MKLCNSYLQRVGGAVLVGQRFLGNENEPRQYTHPKSQ
jgi:hypothetical protein